MVRLTPEQVLALAPDASAVSAGRELANPAKWASIGESELAAWGEAKGSGKNPYQTAVDLREIAYKCSCPSRKLPCKHALGLLLRHAKSEIEPGTPPTWVQEWLDKRAERSEQKAEKAASTPAASPADAEKRTEKRWAKVLAGIEECESFLEDAVSQGLYASQSARSWDQMAARMVDAQAPGIATRLKRIGNAIGVGDAWGPNVAGQLGNLTLLLEAAKRIETLSDGLKADVRTAVGIPFRKEDLTGEPVEDVWDVLGSSIETEDRITTCRSWLQARSTGEWALHLAFSAAGQPFDFQPLIGTAFHSKAQYYPSAYPLRVNLTEIEPQPFQPRKGGLIADGLEFAADVWAQNPWAERVPIPITAGSFGQKGSDWFVIDSTGRALPLMGEDPWNLMALFGNQPIEIVGEWNGSSLNVLCGSDDPWT
jgi:hypothetical protein